MKKLFLLILILASQKSFGQWKYDNNWTFGDSLGIDFSNLSNPLLFYTHAKNDEACGTLSDSSGNLIFYVGSADIGGSDYNHGKIFNRQNQTMQNGDSVNMHWSSTVGAVILNAPEEDSVYYLFSTIIIQPGSIYKIFYSVIDQRLDGGNGSVIEKNIFLVDSVTEKICAIKHGNGRDWWLIAHQRKSDRFIKYLIDSGGIHGPFYQNIGAFYYQVGGEISSSLAGNKLCSVGPLRVKDLFDFDRCSGDLTNYIELGSPPYDTAISLTGIYGCSFSADGSRLYIGEYYDVGSADLHTVINQYSTNAVNVLNSKSVLADMEMDSIGYGQLELAPNGKIYISSGFSSSALYQVTHSLSTIDSPNDSGLACGLNLFSFDLGGRMTRYGLPNFPNYNLGALEGSACDTLTSIQNENLKTKSIVRIYPNPASNQLTVSNGQLAAFDIEIADVLGKEIYESKNNLNSQIINLNSFSAGIYFVKVKMQNGEIQVKKFVKQ